MLKSGFKNTLPRHPPDCFKRNRVEVVEDSSNLKFSKMEKAKERLSKALSVNHWNDIRESLKWKLSVSELAQIDGSGFIKSVKKQNNWISE